MEFAQGHTKVKVSGEGQSRVFRDFELKLAYYSSYRHRTQDQMTQLTFRF